MKTFFPIAMYGLVSFAHGSELSVTFDPAKGRCELTALNGIACDVSAQPRVAASEGVSFDKSVPAAGKVIFSVAGLDAMQVSAAAGRGTFVLAWQPAGAGPALPPLTMMPTGQSDAGQQLAVPANPVVVGVKPGGALPVQHTQAEEKQAAAPGAMPKKNLVFDYTVPESPGFFVLGMAPENIAQPRTARELAMALKNGVDQSGKLKSGVAVDFIPAQLFGNNEDKLDVLRAMKPGGVYPKSTLGRILYNTSVSIATIKGNESDDKSVKLGIGVNFPIFDDSDGRNSTALIDCLQATLIEDSATFNPDAPGTVAGPLKVDAATQAKAVSCRDRILRWNSSALTVSIGGARVTDSGKINESLPSTSGAWFSYSYGFKGTNIKALEEHAQFLVAGKAINKDVLADPRDDSKQISANVRAITMGLKIGSNDFVGSLNQSFSRLRYDGIVGRESVRRWSLGLEYRVAKDTWLVASTGKESGRQFGENQSFVNTSLRFGSETQPATPSGQQ